MSISDRLDEIESVAAYLDDDDMEAEVLSATAALCAVLNLHQLYNQCDDGCCRYCESCEHQWPCPTVRAIEAAVGEES